MTNRAQNALPAPPRSLLRKMSMITLNSSMIHATQRKKKIIVQNMERRGKL